MAIDHNEKNERQRLVDLVRKAIDQDNKLREHYEVGEKFRFVRDRLQALLEQLEKHIKASETLTKVDRGAVTEDEVIVYIYLFNAQGIILNSWINMLTPKLFYEYSVNRPVYIVKNDIEQLIRSKTNKNQHAYITVVAKKKDIQTAEVEKKDAIGNTVIKIREGGLLFERMVAFTHNEVDYMLDEEGDLMKKNPLN